MSLALTPTACPIGTCRVATSAIVGKKFENALQYQSLFPEYRFVYLGDAGAWSVWSLAATMGHLLHDISWTMQRAMPCHAVSAGQGDAGLTHMLMQTAPEHFVGGFIHDVTPHKAHTGDGGSKEEYSREGIHFFHSYAGAAGAACRAGLLDVHSARAVADACQQECTALLSDAAFRGHAGLKKLSARVAVDAQRVRDMPQ